MTIQQNIIWQLLRVQTNYIYNLECVEGMRKHIPDNTIDLCITSPPYNVGIGYDSIDDNLKLDDYFQFANDWLSSSDVSEII